MTDTTDVHIQVCMYLGERDWLDDYQTYPLNGRIPRCCSRLTDVEYNEFVEIVDRNNCDLLSYVSNRPLWSSLIHAVPLHRAAECLQWLYEKHQIPVNVFQHHMYKGYLLLPIEAWIYLESIGMTIYADTDFINDVMYVDSISKILYHWREVSTSLVYYLLSRRGGHRAYALWKFSVVIRQGRLDNFCEPLARCGMTRDAMTSSNWYCSSNGSNILLEAFIEQVDSEVKFINCWLYKLLPDEIVQDTKKYVCLSLNADDRLTQMIVEEDE